MKRNIDLLRDTINSYLNQFNNKSVNNLTIEFDWMDGKKYAVLSDAIFVLKK